jgi:hypothetical protein
VLSTSSPLASGLLAPPSPLDSSIPMVWENEGELGRGGSLAEALRLLLDRLLGALASTGVPGWL